MPDFEPVFLPLVAAIIERPKCPRCLRYGMLIPRREQGAAGFGTLKCRKCGHLGTIMDPLASGAQGWLASELRPPI